LLKTFKNVDVSEVEKSLDQLPEALYPLYEGILEQTNLVHQRLALEILRWCAFAVHPLRVVELASALDIKSTSLELDREAVFSREF
jgi:hypothetical protein